MLNRLRMRHVRCFLTIARCGSMTAAAKEMNSSQPAVSRSLAELETLVGQPLFERGGRGLTLTEAGERLRRHLDPRLAGQRLEVCGQGHLHLHRDAARQRLTDADQPLIPRDRPCTPPPDWA